MLDRFNRFLILFKFDNRWQLLLNRLLWPKRGPNFYQTGELEILVDHSTGDQDGTRSCLIPGLYNPCLTAFPDLPQNLVVLDLGSNGGGFFLFLRQKGFTIRQAVGVELNPHTWSRLLLNTYRNIPDAPACVTLLNGAAGGSDGIIEVALGRGSVGDSILSASKGGVSYRLRQYSFATLTERLASHGEIDICKIDIEGAEYELFRTPDADTIRRCRHFLIEIHDVEGESPSDLINLIESHGFVRINPSVAFSEPNVFAFQRIDSKPSLP